MLPIRYAVEDLLVAYLHWCATNFPQGAPLLNGVGWKVAPTQDTPQAPVNVTRPFVVGHAFDDLPKPCHLVVICDSADPKLDSAGIFTLTVKICLGDAGTKDGLACQYAATNALLAAIPGRAYGGNLISQAIAAMNNLPGQSCAIVGYGPATPFEREGRGDRMFGSELNYIFEAVEL